MGTIKDIVGLQRWLYAELKELHELIAAAHESLRERMSTSATARLPTLSKLPSNGVTGVNSSPYAVHNARVSKRITSHSSKKSAPRRAPSTTSGDVSDAGEPPVL